MIRLIMRVFGITDYEPCKSCEMLRTQLAIANASNRDLHLLLVDIFKPKTELPVNEVNDPKPFRPRLLPSQRRAQLEMAEQNRAKVLAESQNLAVEDKGIENRDTTTEEESIPRIQAKTIEELERELAIGGE